MLKAFRDDKGEYMSNEWERFMLEHGIERQCMLHLSRMVLLSARIAFSMKASPHYPTRISLLTSGVKLFPATNMLSIVLPLLLCPG